MKRTYTAEEKAHALELYAEHGAAEAGARTGINPNTIRSWASREHLTDPRNQRVAAAVAARKITAEQRRSDLADRLLDIAEMSTEQQSRLIRRADLRDVVGAGTRAIHDHLLLTGQATTRTETIHASTVDDEIARLADELAANDTPEAATVGPA